MASPGVDLVPCVHSGRGLPGTSKVVQDPLDINLYIGLVVRCSQLGIARVIVVHGVNDGCDVIAQVLVDKVGVGEETALVRRVGRPKSGSQIRVEHVNHVATLHGKGHAHEVREGD